MGLFTDILNESLSSVLYHFTRDYSLMSLVRDWSFRLTKVFYDDPDIPYGDANINDGYKFFLSFTRCKDARLGYSGDDKGNTGKNVRYYINGDKLNQRFSGHSVNFFSLGTDVQSIKQFKQKQNPRNHFFKEVENEDRLFSDNEYIDNFYKYIERVDWLKEGRIGDYSAEIFVGEELMKHGIPLFVYLRDTDYFVGNNKGLTVEDMKGLTECISTPKQELNESLSSVLYHFTIPSRKEAHGFSRGRNCGTFF